MSPSSNITVDLREVSPTEATEWLQTCEFEGQRPLRRYHVRDLADLMQTGHFRQGSPIDFAVIDEQQYLINGQHTLSAIAQSGRPQLLAITTYNCDNQDDVASLYAGYDRHLRRSPLDALAAFNLRDRLGIPYEAYRSLYPSTGLVSVGFMPDHAFGPRSPRVRYLGDMEIRARLMEAWGDEAEAFATDIQGCQKFIQRMLLRSGVMAVILVTYRFAERAASAFWGPLSRDDRLAQDDPKKALLNFLLTHPANQFDPHVLARYVALAWNSAQAGEQRSLFRVIQKGQSRPIRIDGTPHDGRQHMVYLSDSGEILQDPIAMQNGNGH